MVLRFLVLVTWLAATAAGTLGAAGFPVLPGEPERPAPTPWQPLIEEAERRLSYAPADARAMFARVLQDYPLSEGARRAVSGIASSYVQTRDYQGLTRFLETTVNQDRHPSVAQEARRVYTQVAQRIDTAHMNAYRAYVDVQNRYDSISWFNIFRIFEKFDLKSQLKNLRSDLDYITDVKLLFNPVYLLPPEAVPADGGAPTGGTEVAGGSLPAPPPLPPPLDIDPGGLVPTDESPGQDSGQASKTSTGDGKDEDEDEDEDEEASGAAGSDDAAGETPASAGTDPAAAAISDLDRKLEAVKLLQEELARILELVPEDRRDEARDIIVGHGGYALLPVLEKDVAGSEDGTAGAPDPAAAAGDPGDGDAVPAADEETAATAGAAGTESEETEDAGAGSSGDTAAGTGTGETVPSGDAQTPAPATDPAIGEGQDTAAAASSTDPGATAAEPPAVAAAPVDVETLKTRMLDAYSQLMDKMRRGEREGAVEIRQTYIDALAAYRQAQFESLRPTSPPLQAIQRVPPTLPGPDPAPGGDSVAASTTQTGPEEGGASPAGTGASPSEPEPTSDPDPVVTPTGPARVNTQTNASGRPVTDQNLYNMRGSFRR